MAEIRSTDGALGPKLDKLQKTVDQILDVIKAQLIETRRFVDLLEEMTYVDGEKRRRLGVADLK